MSKYKVGDKFVIEINSEYFDNYKIKETDLILSDYTLNKLQKYEDDIASKTYEDGLNDAWKVLEHIQSGELSEEDIKNIWNISDTTFLNSFTEIYTPQEALKILEAYEKPQQIQVGDIIQHKDGTYGVVTRFVGGIADVLWEDGTVSTESYVDELHKTGKTRDISSILEQIRGNE
jgi:uncharacterized protein YkvS